MEALSSCPIRERKPPRIGPIMFPRCDGFTASCDFAFAICVPQLGQFGEVQRAEQVRNGRLTSWITASAKLPKALGKDNDPKLSLGDGLARASAVKRK